MSDGYIHRDFQDAYLANLQDITSSYNFDVAPRGQASLEKIGINFRIRNPVQRVCQVPARKTNIVFNFAEALWYLSGSNRIDFITHYGPSLARYSSDGNTLTGTAYGPKLFSRPSPQEPNQWDRVVHVLRHDDPTSKRAVISIFDSAEVILRRNIDVSCTICLQCGVEVGEYHHSVGSMHIYKSDLARASEVLNDGGGDAPRHEFPAMPLGDNWPYIRQVLEAERAIREDSAGFDLRVWKAQLPEYWYQVVLLLVLFQTVIRKGMPGTDISSQLFPIYRDLVRNRWPRLVT
jgi:thymidylate synthase